MSKIDIILCTRDPHRGRMARTLAGLEGQSMRASSWQLVIVDSASTSPLSVSEPTGLVLSDVVRVRVVREKAPGLTAARLRGIRESSAPLLLFVDDDNVLAENYLEVLIALSEAHPQIASFGASISAEFEEQPDPKVHDYLSSLAIREVSNAVWSNNYDFATAPYGAGLAVRRKVAEAYAHAVLGDPRRLRLGRIGNKLLACEDIDLAFTANDLGFGCGLFPELRLTHLIPATRLQPRYLKRISIGAGESAMVLTSIRRPEAIHYALLFERLAVYAGLLFFRGITERRRKIAYTRGQILGIWKILRSRP